MGSDMEVERKSMEVKYQHQKAIHKERDWRGPHNGQELRSTDLWPSDKLRK